MLRILRAFAWMRWRVLINSLELTGGRDRLERLSVALGQVAPLVVAVLFVPSAMALAALAGYTGYALATPGEPPVTLQVLRYLLLAVLALCIVGPVLLPAADRVGAVRLLLLPIPRRTLYVAQTSGALADPWIALVVAVAAALPVGLALGGAATAAVAALLAGGLFLLVLLGISSLTTSVLHLLLRDRRRGELLALLFIVIVPMLAMMPGLLQSQNRAGAGDERARAPRSKTAPTWMTRTGARLLALAPSELYYAGIVGTTDRGAAAGLAPLAGLAVTAGAIHALGLMAFGRILDSPATSGGRRASGAAHSRMLTLPLLSPGASAVAISHVRLVLRTPRGRSTLLSPIGVFVMLALLMRRSGEMDLGVFALNSGIALAMFAAAVCLLSILPFAMNQFAVDRAGLTLELLAPLSDLQILAGKAVGNGLLAVGPAVLCVAIAYALFPQGEAVLWLGVPLGVTATYVLAAPAAATLSALFPKAVNLNSIGSGSNAHGLAGLLGLAAFAVAAAPPVLLAVLAGALIDHPAGIPVVLLGWCGISFLTARVLYAPVVRLFTRRRENLSLIG